MNLDNSDFENELRLLRPVAASKQLVTRITCTLTPPVVAPGSVVSISRWLPWSVAAASMMLACFLALRAPSTDHASDLPAQTTGENQVRAQPNPAQLVPVSSSNRLISTRDEGIVFINGNEPARKVRYEFVDTVELRTSSNHAAVGVSWPREEVRFEPLQTF